MKWKAILLSIALIVILFSTTQCNSAPSNVTTNTLSPLDGKSLVETKCTACHGLDRIESKSMDSNGWKTTVERMISHGAELTADEQMAVIEYLAKTYP